MPPDQARDQTGIFQFADADRHIERLGHQIDTAWGQVEFEREVKSSEVDRERNPQDTARLLNHRAELFVREPCLVDDSLASLIIELAGLGELDLARRAMQQSQADRLLQLADTSRQSGVWHAESLRGLPKAPGSGHLHEQRHVVQMAQLIAP